MMKLNARHQPLWVCYIFFSAEDCAILGDVKNITEGMMKMEGIKKC
jgi:hypothetical protein